jgi:hypothetical protein
MSEARNTLSSQEKATLISTVDLSFNDAIKSMRKKMIEDSYLTSATQVATLDKILLTVNANENNNLHKVIFDNLVSQKQLILINNIKDMFKEGWMLSKAFRFYTGGAPIKSINSWSMKSIMAVIETKDRSKFDTLGLDDNARISKDAKSKVFKKKPFTPKPTKIKATDIPIIIKKAT